MSSEADLLMHRFEKWTTGSLVDGALGSLFGSLLYSGGHGAGNGHLGFGLIYYVIAAGLPASVCVCLGSGGGFVPGLMRQAQRDLARPGMRTYLVDAILPELGTGTPEGGWFSENSLLRRKFPDIVQLCCLTTEAATYFEKNNVRIDFLHIDADHSREAVLADFRAYRGLLSPRAFVTFHDASMSSVQEALETIEREFPEFSVLQLPDIGNGLAILRRKDPSASTAGAPLEGPGGQEPARSDDRDGEIWSYLLDPALRTRYALAAHFLRGFDAILEVGGYRTPITDFLTHSPGKVVVVDPYIEPREESSLRGRPCQVHHVAADLDRFDDSEIVGGPYALVFLGMDLYDPQKTMAQTVATYTRFAELLSRAQRAVLEYPPAWGRSKRLFDVLLSLLQPRIVYECFMDLSNNPVDGLEDDIKAERLVRRFVVLDRMEPVADRAEVRRKLARGLYGSGAEAVLAGGRESFDLVPGALRMRDARLAFPEAAFQIHDSGELWVRASQKPWSYAFLVPFRCAQPARRAAIVHVRGCVEKGTLTFGALRDDESEVVGERFMTARPGYMQEIDIFVPDLATVQGLLCRNGQRAEPSEGVVLQAELLIQPANR